MNTQNSYKQIKNGGFASLVILFAIVLAGVYFMAVQIENNQKGATENSPEKNGIDASLDIVSEAQLRADLINQEQY
jgi:hypothetical protein